MKTIFVKIASFFTSDTPYTMAGRLLCAGLCCLSGASGGLIFTFDGLWPLAFVFLVPYILVMLGGRGGWPTGFVCSLIYSFTFYTVMLSWFGEMKDMIFSGLDEATAEKTVLAALIATALVESVVFSSIISLTRIFRSRGRKITGLLGFCALFCLCETVPEYMGDIAFPWGRLANLVAPFDAFIQSSSLFGGLFVTLLVLLVNGGVALWLLNFSEVRARRTAIIMSAAVLLLNSGYGIVRAAVTESRYKGEEQIGVLLVQGNFGSDIKWGCTAETMRDRYLELSHLSLTPEIKLVVWPETAMVTALNTDSETREMLSGFACDNSVTLITGAFLDSGTDEPAYNSCWVFTPDGKENPVYSKQVLVPMGEKVPFENTMRELMPYLFDEDSIISGVSQGDKTVTVDTGAFVEGSFICYESIVPHIVRENTVQGAELLVMVTNDSWFGKSAALTQHLSHAKLRACENGRWLLRAANTGITAVVSPTGRIVAQTESLKQTVLTVTAAPRTSRTLYSLTGDLVAPASALYLLLLLCGLIVSGIRSRRKAAADGTDTAAPQDGGTEPGHRETNLHEAADAPADTGQED